MSRLPWHNEYPVDADSVSNALRADIPELADTAVVALGEGWDFLAFRVGEWVLRFPKRRSSARALSAEIGTLDAIHSTLGERAAGVPRYRWVVEQPKTLALPYAGYRYLDGRSLMEVAPEAATVQRVGGALGTLLGHVHALSPTPPPRRYYDQFAGHIGEFRHQLERLHDVLPADIATSIRTLLAAPPPRYRGPARFCHADLLVEHVLVSDPSSDRDGVAVIDWADARWDDPWSDFVGLWAWGGDAAVHAAVAAYGVSPANEDWCRIRYKTACVCVGQSFYGHLEAQRELLAESIRTLERMMCAGQINDPTRTDV